MLASLPRLNSRTKSTRTRWSWRSPSLTGIDPDLHVADLVPAEEDGVPRLRVGQGRGPGQSIEPSRARTTAPDRPSLPRFRSVASMDPFRFPWGARRPSLCRGTRRRRRRAVGSRRSRLYYDGKGRPAQVQERAERGRTGGWGRSDRSADGDHGRESVAREQFQGTVEGKLAGVVRRDLAPDDDLPLDLLDDRFLIRPWVDSRTRVSICWISEGWFGRHSSELLIETVVSKGAVRPVNFRSRPPRRGRSRSSSKAGASLGNGRFDHSMDQDRTSFAVENRSSTRGSAGWAEVGHSPSDAGVAFPGRFSIRSMGGVA